MKNCNKCSVNLIIGSNMTEGRYKSHSWLCTPCENARMRLLQASKREFVAKYKMSIGCECCGWNGHPAALDLAHINADEKAVSGYGNNRSAYKQSWSIAKIEKELVKCRVLCANCHRIETAIENGWKDYGND